MACNGSKSKSTNSNGNGGNGSLSGQDIYTHNNGGGFHTDARDSGQPGSDSVYDFKNTSYDNKIEVITDDWGSSAIDSCIYDNGDNGDNINVDSSNQTCLDCMDYLRCVNKCQVGIKRQECIKDCDNQTCEGHLHIAREFRSCAERNCLDEIQSQSDLLQISCFVDKCLDQLIGCYHGDNYKTCVDVINCMNECPKDNPSTPNVDEQYQCVDDCRSNATEEAAKDYWHMIGCMIDECKSECNCQSVLLPCWKECTGCIEDAFYSEECFPYVKKCTPHGDLTCGQILRCMSECPEDDPSTYYDEHDACIFPCFDKGTSEAQDKFEIWKKCAINSCKTQCQKHDSPQCQQCIQEAQDPQKGACKDQVNACLQDTAGTNGGGQ